jgi:ribosomal protein S21
MIIINVNNNNPLERALKTLKRKVINVKQNEILRNKKEFVKKSVKLRSQKLKAIYLQKITNSH